MIKYLITVVLGVVLLSFVQLKEQNPPKDKAKENYKQYCSTCHGEKVEAFVDRQWKHGKTKAELIASITNGYNDMGMPTWKGILKDKEIADLANLIIKNFATLEQYKFDKPVSPIFKSEELTIKIDTIASGLNSPWGMAFLPDNGMLITDRSGKMYRLDKNNQKSEVTGVPAVLAQGQGGLLDVELHPNYSQNQYVYISYSAFKEENGAKLSTTAIMRAKLEGNALTEQKIIFEALPYSKTRHHYGSRLTFDKNGYLFFSVGDRGNEKENPQSLDNDCGKIHRIHDDGKIPVDNPFVAEKNARTSIFSYGHRNPQGMVLNQETGEIWEHEHGPRGGDELNIVKKSKNYGWPVICYGINYDGKTITNLTEKEGMEQPETYWIPSIAPSGMTFVNNDRYKTWKGNLLIGSLRFKYLNRCVLKNGKIIKQESILPNIGRVRNVKMSPDGYIYVAVEELGYVFKLNPM
jgi:glucose/arabinose dehydrogenase